MKTQRTVPFFDYPRLFLDDSQTMMEIFEEIGERGAYILQREVAELEAEIANYVGVQHAVGVGNATDGLELAWMAIGLKPGDEVIVSAHTMVATASAIITAGGIPVPVDIGKDNLMDPSSVEAAIGPRTVGVMPTQLNGRVCEMDEINRIVAKHGLAMVEDAAQALGARYKGRAAGSFGLAAAFSFFPAKVLGCLGDGGAVTTSSEDIFEQVFMLHDHGRKPNSTEVYRWGRNSRLDNLQAAILLNKLPNYNNVILRRREIANLYQSLMGDLHELVLPPAPTQDGVNFDVFQNYELSAERRDELRGFLKDRGIGTLIQWGGSALNHFEHLGLTKYHLPRTDKFFENCLMLPMNVFLSDDDVAYTASTVRSFYRN